jgi:two-component system phosphate regulon response regulator PhoB
MASPPRAHLLIVEDDGDLLEVLKYVVEDAGYVVSTAEDGPSALAIARSEPVDLVLLDIGMADVSGVEVAKLLRSEPSTAHMRIAVHTGLDEASVRAGFADYDLFLTKSDDPAELLQAIAALLGRTESSNTPANPT